jgi:DNA-binding CsgD family transcriptional regulator
MELTGVEVASGTYHPNADTAPTAITREQVVRRLGVSASADNTPGALRMLAEYVGASHFLFARCDLIQEQGLDFIVSSDFPFDVVRRIGVELASSYAKSTELEKCLSLLTPIFAVLPDDVLLPDDVSRQYCSLAVCIGRIRYSLLLLFHEGIILSQDRLREVGLLATYAVGSTARPEGRAERDFELTERELECLFWIAEGKTSDEIAMILGISRNTINNYITSVMRKTGTKTRSEAIAYAVRNNLV